MLFYRILFYFFLFFSLFSQELSRILILPFYDLSSLEEYKWMQDVLASSLSTSLKERFLYIKVDPEKALPWVKKEKYPYKKEKLQDLADSLGVDYILWGGYRVWEENATSLVGVDLFIYDARLKKEGEKFYRKGSVEKEHFFLLADSLSEDVVKYLEKEAYSYKEPVALFSGGGKGGALLIDPSKKPIYRKEAHVGSLERFHSLSLSYRVDVYKTLLFSQGIYLSYVHDNFIFSHLYLYRRIGWGRMAYGKDFSSLKEKEWGSRASILSPLWYFLHTSGGLGYNFLLWKFLITPYIGIGLRVFGYNAFPIPYSIRTLFFLEGALLLRIPLSRRWILFLEGGGLSYRENFVGSTVLLGTSWGFFSSGISYLFGFD